MYVLLRVVLSLFGVRPDSGVVGCVVTPKFNHMIKCWVTTVVIAIIVVLVVQGHAVEVFTALAAAWLVDVLDMAARGSDRVASSRVTKPAVS